MSNKIAVIGMACRFPGARNIDEYWSNLLLGKESITRFEDNDLVDFEYNFDLLRNNPDYVRARGIIDDIDKFDPAFFGMTPGEAAATDPQHRIWLQTVWEAFENAGCNPYNYNGAIGVFAGGSFSTYLLNNILRDPIKMENFIRLRTADSYQVLTGNDPSFISTKTAYKFNLKGPAINVQTACSTSLVAIALACQSLFSYESDLCIAGGVRILIPQETGYIFQEGGIPSPDGKCRPFDAKAKGTVPGNGVGVVVLKRLEDAEKDGDTIYAVVRGWAINNDGKGKVSYTAPSIEGQAEAIMMAQSFAEVLPEEISYIEAHGTATQLGDPIEVAALKKAFSRKTDKKGFCGIGSVKSNIGHTDCAAGVASFIKACLIEYNKIIPATLNYLSPNPNIDFENSPFYVQNELKRWNNEKPLISGVSSFGIGGTNTHVILEEPPSMPKQYRTSSDRPELIVLSANSEKSLNKRKEDIIEFAGKRSQSDIRDIAYSLMAGRNHMKFRSFMVASNKENMISSDTKFTDGKINDLISKVVFMFPGQGTQYLNMGKDLYCSDKFFREILDDCFRIFKNETSEDLKAIVFSDNGTQSSISRIDETEITQPALFIIEYALAKLLLKFGIEPSCMIGHSIGEYVAACIAGVFDLESALKVVIMRGKMMQAMPSGKMMAVMTDKARLDRIKDNLFEVAAENALQACTISFKKEQADKVAFVLKENEIQFIELKTSHAFHSSDFDPILNDFSAYVNQFRPVAPEIPFISCLTGTFITDEQATSGNYWAQQLRNTVLFNSGISTISSLGEFAYLEVGPNSHLSSLVKHNEKVTDKHSVICTLGKPDFIDENVKLVRALGNLFNVGISIDPAVIYGEDRPQKIFLPTYPFDNKHCWIDFKLSGEKDESIFKIETDSKTKDNRNNDGHNLAQTSDRVEETILGIWKMLFGVDNIAADENFFDIGGHSLLALQILTRVKEEFNQSISLKTFMENPTIKGLCSSINSEINQDNEKVEIPHLTDLSHLSLSDTQKRLWIISKMNGENPSYNIPFTYYLKGKLDIDVFRESINILFQRHHIMFSVFKESDNNPYCTIEPHKVGVELIDYSSLPTEVRKEKILSFIRDDSRRCFDVEKGPLYRLFLLKDSEECFYFHVNIHHLIFDGWSWGIFVRDLNKIYNSVIEKKIPDLVDLPVQYYDYANWQLSHEEESNEEELKEFWINYLKDCPPAINFPYDNVRGSEAIVKGGKINIKIPEDQTKKLKVFCKRENTTLFSILLSAYSILLYKYSGDADICLGTPVSSRPMSKLEDVFGMFIKTVAIRIKVDTKISFANLVEEVKNSTFEAISHQNLPFEKVVEVINPVRTLNMNPLFQICFAWQSNLSMPLNIKEVKGERVTIEEGISPFDITLYMWENENFIEGEIEYNRSLINTETATGLRRNFLNLIESLADNVDAPISLARMISNEEVNIVKSFTDTKQEYPKDKTVSELFEEQVILYPTKTALVFKNKAYTYLQLNEKANQLANSIIDLGIDVDDPIAILCDKSDEMIIGLLAILKAGGCYVPIDPDYPSQRIDFMLKDSSCKVLLTQNKYANIKVDGIKVIDINTDDAFSKNNTNPDRHKKRSDLAYIMYTSGTTGTPKGSLIKQKGIVRLIRNTNYINISNDDKILLTGAIVFDASTFEIWGALLNGGTLFVVEKETILSPDELGSELYKNDISILWLTSPLFTQIAELRADIFGRLKYLLVGGDVLSPSHINKVRKDNPDLKIINGYGPTENTTFSTTFLIDRDFKSNIPIGKPISNSTAYIFDNDFNYQPIGIIGDLYVGGDGLTKGYLNRDDLNQRCFIDNPYNPGERLYRTGDRARWLPDGNIEFHGRADNQLKIRGFRVELEEVESAISGIDGIIETVVKAVKVGEGDVRLVAFINAPGRSEEETGEIKEIIKDKLPQYMIPSAIKIMKSFPKTINGKIDRNALNVDLKQVVKQEKCETDSFTETEKAIYKVWSEALKIKEISVDDNFFSIGGNSLLAISVVLKISKETGYDLNLKLFFDSPRIRDIAESIDLFKRKKIESEKNVIVKNGDTNIVEGEI